jgi:hypothetical protein
VSGYPLDDMELAQQFGASVNVKIADDSGLFFIVGAGVFPGGAVTSLGGQVLMRFPGTNKVLAILSTSAYIEDALHHPDFALVGPVVIDPARFAAFADLIHLNDEPSAERGPLL